MLKLIDFYKLQEEVNKYPVKSNFKFCIGISGHCLGKINGLDMTIHGVNGSFVYGSDGLPISVINDGDQYIPLPSHSSRELALFSNHEFIQTTNCIGFDDREIQQMFEAYVLLPLFLVDYHDSKLLYSYTSEIVEILIELRRYSSDSSVSGNRYTMAKVIYSYGQRIDRIMKDCLETYSAVDEYLTSKTAIEGSSRFNSKPKTLHLKK